MNRKRGGVEEEEPSPREAEALKLLATGCSFEQIAEEMRITVKSVRNNVLRGRNRLGLANSRQAVAIIKEDEHQRSLDAEVERQIEARELIRPDYFIDLSQHLLTYVYRVNIQGEPKEARNISEKQSAIIKSLISSNIPSSLREKLMRIYLDLLIKRGWIVTDLSTKSRSSIDMKPIVDEMTNTLADFTDDVKREYAATLNVFQANSPYKNSDSSEAVRLLSTTDNLNSILTRVVREKNLAVCYAYQDDEAKVKRVENRILRLIDELCSDLSSFEALELICLLRQGLFLCKGLLRLGDPFIELKLALDTYARIESLGMKAPVRLLQLKSTAHIVADRLATTDQGALRLIEGLTEKTKGLEKTYPRFDEGYR